MWLRVVRRAFTLRGAILIGLPVLLVLLVSVWWANRSPPDGGNGRTSERQPPAPAAGMSQAEAEAFCESKIGRVRDGTCSKSHGGEQVRGGLRVDPRVALLEGGDNGPAIVPGDSDNSLLIQAIRHTHPDLQMPPGKQLPAAV